jgi:hypothetical protein
MFRSRKFTHQLILLQKPQKPYLNMVSYMIYDIELHGGNINKMVHKLIKSIRSSV